MDEVSLYEQERRQKVAKLREIGVDPFGTRTAGIEDLAKIKALYKPEMGHDGGPAVIGAGRVMLKRDMGKLSFLTLRDHSGDLQVALDKKRLSERDWQVRDLIDLGDQIVIEGNLGQTNKGETTIWAKSVSMAAKALLPPPAKWEGLSDVELRYRQRYVDLWANPDVMRIMKLRIRVVEEIRKFLSARGFVEVETPMMQSIPGGAAARPFVTHHNALDIPLYLRIAPELYLKRLLVGGMPKIFELNRNFRNEGISPRHNPEFTMLEVYEAYGNWETMADLIEEMICQIAMTLFGSLKIIHRRGAEAAETDAERTINLERPWRRATMAELVEEKLNVTFQREGFGDEDIKRIAVAYLARGDTEVEERVGKFAERVPKGDPNYFGFLLSLEARQKAINFYEHLRNATPAEQLVEVYEKLIEPALIDPCFVTQVPSVVIPLARENKADPYFADVYELAINGQEISPGYTELNDPEIQAKHFAHQVGDKADQQKVDEDFLTALKYGMPPAGGLGMGVDRLVAMLTGAESLRDVILFPLMRPQEK